MLEAEIRAAMARKLAQMAKARRQAREELERATRARWRPIIAWLMRRRRGAS